MYDPMTPHQLHTRQHLRRKSPDDRRREPSELICLDELVQIDTEEFGDNAEVRAEVEVVGHPNHVMFVLGVLSHQLGLLTSQGKRSVPNPQAAQGS
jgi:hypothetical protein